MMNRLIEMIFIIQREDGVRYFLKKKYIYIYMYMFYFLVVK